MPPENPKAQVLIRINASCPFCDLPLYHHKTPHLSCSGCDRVWAAPRVELSQVMNRTHQELMADAHPSED